ncbi:aminotransferase class V-fold PLP-dependent enzyme [Halovulum sp. GXIMD14794]
MDIDALRAETPGCADGVHFNNAGAALMPVPVLQAVRDHLDLEARHGGYEAARRAAPRIEAFYDEIAALLNADPGEIAFTENATRAWNMAFYGLGLGPGDRVLTHEAEYASNALAMLQLRQRSGIEIDLAPSDADGQIDLDAAARMVTTRTKVLALTHVPTQGGLVNPAEAAGAFAREHGLLYFLDACQSAGQVALDVHAIGCDVLSGTGRKYLRGPRGTGFLYVRSGALERVVPAFIDLTAATWTGPESFDYAPGARRFETFERNIAGQIGLARAVAYARAVGIEAIETRVVALAEDLRATLAHLPGVTVTDRGTRKAGIVTFVKDGRAPADMHVALRAQGFATSVSTAPMAQFDLHARGVDALMRASVHYYNTEDEVARFAEAVSAL